MRLPYSPKCRNWEFDQEEVKKHISCSHSPPCHLCISPYTEWGGVSILLGKCLLSACYVLDTVLTSMYIKSHPLW